jgi:hypothetical protein
VFLAFKWNNGTARGLFAKKTAGDGSAQCYITKYEAIRAPMLADDIATHIQ